MRLSKVIKNIITDRMVFGAHAEKFGSSIKNRVISVLVPGFEPGSKAREAFMMGHYTIRATGHRLVTRIYSERVVAIFTFTQK